MRRYQFVHLDVFTHLPFTGNQLAVFTDARGLSDEEMQMLAREMNLSETTYILPTDQPTEAERGVRVRIFTIDEELPFAGHPTLGTAWAVREMRGGLNDQIKLCLNVGTIPVHFSTVEDRLFGEMRQRDPEFGRIHDREALARAAGIPLEDFDPELPIQTVSTGLAYGIVPLRSLEAIRRLRFSYVQLHDFLAHADTKFLYFVTRETVDPAARLHARMIFYSGEDPATGSAAGDAAAWMVKYGVAKSDERVLIEQGIEMRRPSRIFVRATRDGDRVVNVRVGGNVVEVMRGEVFL